MSGDVYQFITILSVIIVRVFVVFVFMKPKLAVALYASEATKAVQYGCTVVECYTQQIVLLKEKFFKRSTLNIGACNCHHHQNDCAVHLMPPGFM